MTRKERIKQHFQQYKSYYLVAGTAVTVAGITTLIMRDPKLSTNDPGPFLRSDLSESLSSDRPSQVK